MYQRSREGLGFKTVRKDKRGGKKIFPLSFLPPNLLVIFISFYWLIFNTISFCFILFFFVFILALRLLLNPFLFVMVMAMSIHLIDMPLDEECMILIKALRRIVWVKRGSHPYYSSHILCGLVYNVGDSSTMHLRCKVGI
jgi:hypothetical protein